MDRIELRNGKIRIIDYKTGKVEKANVVLKSWNGLTQELKNDKIIQVLAYAFMFEKEAGNLPIEVGIISFKNLKAGFMPFQIKEGRELVSDVVDDSVLNDFKTELIVLLNEILNVDLPFEEKIV